MLNQNFGKKSSQKSPKSLTNLVKSANLWKDYPMGKLVIVIDNFNKSQEKEALEIAVSICHTHKISPNRIHFIIKESQP